MLITVLTHSGIKLFVNKERMQARSGMFRDMFDIGESSGLIDEIPMAETGAMLDLILPYWQSTLWDLISVAEKYDVSLYRCRAVRATELTLA